MKVTDSILADLDQLAARSQQRQVLPKDVTAHQVLQMNYRGEIELTPQQQRSAIASLAVETPKLTAVAVGKFTGDDFASRLERAIMRSTGSKTPIPPPRLLTDQRRKPLPDERHWCRK